VHSHTAARRGGPKPAMSKLYFRYAAMNAGKSTALLQVAHNYEERGLRVLLFTAAHDQRAGAGVIGSRLGLQRGADTFGADTEFAAGPLRARAGGELACVLIDEAQFLTGEQVWQLARLADEANIPVLCYGLRTDFQGELFPGSAVLLGVADSLVELKAVCHCGRKATMNLRVDAMGAAVKAGAQTEIGGNDRYVSLCRKHFSEALSG
jgi:thymidine kinase